MRKLLAITLLTLLAVSAHAASLGTAIVIQDRAALRASPRDSAKQQAQLWQGETLEIRGERLDYLQVYDYQRERGGFVRASQVRRLNLLAEDAADLLAVVRFVRDTPGSEALGIGLIAAFIQAAPAEVINGDMGVEALDALGTLADRLAQRASGGAVANKSAEAALAAHLDVAARYGIKFVNYERDERMRICYDGDAFRRVLSMRSTGEQRARAVLALTRDDCIDPRLRITERNQLDESRAEVLDRVDAATLPGYLKNRVLMRRAGIWSALAYQRARQGIPSADTGARALTALAGVNKSELTDDDLTAFSDAAMRASASRWAAVPETMTVKTRFPAIVTLPSQAGQTCIALVDAKHDGSNPLVKRCTYGVVWTNSSTLNREGNALALAVQQTDTWRELWIFRKSSDGWTIGVLPPATTSPELGYAEFAGWVPGGTEMLVAREARGEGKYKRNFELVRLDSLSTARQASDPSMLGAFQRWQDPVWKRETLSLR
ncbi:MAG: hypothetical protein JWN23_1361 [Rhodocyclales bacterium]|nr:hypothetical protein [Rhodocyclales bacterium]